jgi:hypothetical protein
MELKFSNTGNDTNLSEIKEVEDTFGIKFPEEYVDFLLKFNGGAPNKVYFLEDDADIVFNFFLSLKNSEFNVVEYYNDLVLEQNLFPKEIIPIAEDVFGNVICISCRVSDYGTVYFADHESNYDLSEISNSFDFIINNLIEEF